MDPLLVPKGPIPDRKIYPDPSASFPPVGSGSITHSRLESIVGVLTLPFPLLPKEISIGYFEPYRTEIAELHKEVRFCLWAMNVSLAVYMKLLCLVDINIRQEISDVVGNFLAGWKEGRTHALSDSLDVLIISEFTKRSITPIPDMALLQREKHCDSISSTVAAYIRDIAINLDNMRQNDLDGTIQSLFPFTEKFIGRCFFPRLAVVASRLLDLIKLDSCQALSCIDSDDSNSSILTDSTSSVLTDLTSSP